ncbi:MAG TPA: hypothetical protein VE988_03020, partial [Gemmataceae bacterium]|nr:hypothetical protein [Gemmataceae bacterium]
MMIPRSVFVLLAVSLLLPSVNAQPPAKPRTDSLGDPLPPGAIARLGTLRFKHDPGRSARVHTAIFSPDGKKIASLADNGTLRLWDAATGKEFPGPWNTEIRCTAIAFSPDSTLLAADFGRTLGGGVSLPLTLWNMAKAEEVKSLHDEMALAVQADPKKNAPNLDLSTRSLAFTDDGKTLFAARRDGTVRSWDVAMGKETRAFLALDGKQKPPQADNNSGVAGVDFSFSPGAKHLAAHVHWLANVKKGKKSSTQIVTAVINLDPSGVNEPWRIEGKTLGMPIVFSADNKRVAITVAPNEVELRDTLTGKLLASPPLEQMFRGTGKIFGLALSSDGSTMAVAGRGDLRVALWNLKNPDKFRTIITEAPYTRDAQCVAFSPDNKTLLIGAASDIQLY